MTMSNIDEFTNTLKDYWAGREYRFGNIIYKIIKDHDEILEFVMIIVLPSEEKKIFHRSTRDKEYLREYFNECGYLRIK